MLDPQKKLDAPTLLLIGGIIFWIALYAIIGPQTPPNDAFHFKDSGINLAIGKGLREVCTGGNPSLGISIMRIILPSIRFSMDYMYR